MLLSLLIFYEAGENETLLLYRIIIPIREKENLLSLYIALNKTFSEDVDALEIREQLYRENNLSL